MKSILVLFCVFSGIQVYAAEQVYLYRICEQMNSAHLPVSCYATCSKIDRVGDTTHYTLTLDVGPTQTSINIEPSDRADIQIKNNISYVTAGEKGSYPYFEIHADDHSNVKYLNVNYLECRE